MAQAYSPDYTLLLDLYNRGGVSCPHGLSPEDFRHLTVDMRRRHSVRLAYLVRRCAVLQRQLEVIDSLYTAHHTCLLDQSASLTKIVERYLEESRSL